jgi:hypothetical protein
MNMLNILRHRPMELIGISGMLVMMLMYFVPQAAGLLLVLPADAKLGGVWERTSGGRADMRLTFTEQKVMIEPLFKSYPISITGDTILYPDSQQQQSYRIGMPLSSLLMLGSGRPQVIITTPGPIPMGIYTYEEFKTITWCPTP